MWGEIENSNSNDTISIGLVPQIYQSAMMTGMTVGKTFRIGVEKLSQNHPGKKYKNRKYISPYLLKYDFWINMNMILEFVWHISDLHFKIFAYLSTNRYAVFYWIFYLLIKFNHFSNKIIHIFHACNFAFKQEWNIIRPEWMLKHFPIHLGYCKKFHG